MYNKYTDEQRDNIIQNSSNYQRLRVLYDKIKHMDDDSISGIVCDTMSSCTIDKCMLARVCAPHLRLERYYFLREFFGDDIELEYI